MRKFDVAIAGAGLIGGAAALELSRKGLRVALFDAKEPGREASYAGAGMLTLAPENPGTFPLVPLAKASLELYPEFVKVVEELSGCDVGFRATGAMEILPCGKTARDLSTIIALHHGLGLKAEVLRAEEARGLEPALSEEIVAAVLRPEEASVDNRALTAAVLKAAEQSGVEIFAGTEVTSIWREGQRCSGFFLGDEKVSAKSSLIAAGCFSCNIPGAEQYVPVRPAKGQMIALRSGKIKINRVLWSDQIYLAPKPDGRILAGSTVEYVGYNKTLTAGPMEHILSAAIELVPALESAQIEEMWAGLRPDSPDHLPILGPTDLDSLFIATGHFRNGILLTPITAQLIVEWITGGKVSPEWQRFSPMRFLDTTKTAQ